MRVAIIVHGGLKIGMGHVCRCLTLADGMKDKAEITFFPNRDQTLINYISSHGFLTYQCTDYSSLINKLKKINPDRVIIDKLDVREHFVRALKENIQTKLTIFGNPTSANKYADIVVSDFMGQYKNNRVQNLKYLDNYTNTLYFSGPKYVILRKEFFEIRKRYKIHTDNIEKILLTFGGSDPANLTTLVLHNLWKSNRKYKINVVLGARYSWMDEISHLIDQFPDRKKQLAIYRNVCNIGELMYSADLVICSLGASFFEALCVGTPVIGISENSIQTRWFKGFLPALEKNQVSLIKNIIDSADYINPNSESIRKMEIGEGKDELVKAILGD